MILSAIGILMVVDAHAWSSLQLFTSFMPYNSFFMPMFVFISGYFFSKNSLDRVKAELLKKIRHLIVPYYIWILLYGLLVHLLKSLSIISYGEDFSFSTLLIKPWTTGALYKFTDPLWFVPALFLTWFFYYFIRKIIGSYWNDWISFLIFVCLGAFCVVLSRHGYAKTEYYLPWLKTGFLLQFYQMGQIFRHYIEPSFKKCPKWPVLAGTLLINIFLQIISPESIDFPMMLMGEFHNPNPFLPLITSITGILFWLSISEILVPALGNNPLVNYISNNTFWIMANHAFFFNVLNAALYLTNRLFHLGLAFDSSSFTSNVWYRYEPVTTFRFVYVLFGLSGCILSKKLFDFFIRNFLKNLGSSNQSSNQNN